MSSKKKNINGQYDREKLLNLIDSAEQSASGMLSLIDGVTNYADYFKEHVAPFASKMVYNQFVTAITQLLMGCSAAAACNLDAIDNHIDRDWVERTEKDIAITKEAEFFANIDKNNRKADAWRKNQIERFKAKFAKYQKSKANGGKKKTSDEQKSK